MSKVLPVNSSSWAPSFSFFLIVLFQSTSILSSRFFLLLFSLFFFLSLSLGVSGGTRRELARYYSQRGCNAKHVPVRRAYVRHDYAFTLLSTSFLHISLSFSFFFFFFFVYILRSNIFVYFYSFLSFLFISSSFSIIFFPPFFFFIKPWKL